MEKITFDEIRERVLEFTRENLICFESTFFDVHSDIYKHQRYGQALVNTFGADCLIEDTFYNKDVSDCRQIAWHSLEQDSRE